MHVQLECLGLHQNPHSLHSCSVPGNIALQPLHLPHAILELLPLLTTAAATASCWQGSVWSATTCSGNRKCVKTQKKGASWGGTWRQAERGGGNGAASGKLY